MVETKCFTQKVKILFFSQPEVFKTPLTKSPQFFVLLCSLFKLRSFSYFHSFSFYVYLNIYILGLIFFVVNRKYELIR
jgi:hypothetical protein